MSHNAIVKTTSKTPAQTSFQQGKRERQQGNFPAAVACFRETIRLQADFVPAYNNLGNALQALGQIDAAIAVYAQALQLAPNTPVLHCNLASLWQIQGERERAMAGYRQVLALNPGFFPAHHNLGKIFAAEGDFESAMTAYQTALRLKPDASEIQIDCGNLYHQHGYIQEAIACYKAAIRYQPQSAQAYNSLGAALQQRHEMKLSEACYRRALTFQPDFDLPHFNLAQLLENAGQLATAQTHYERALALRPDNTKVFYYLNFLRQNQADWDDYEDRVAELIARTEEHLQQKNSEGLPARIALVFPMPMPLRKAVAEHLARFYAKQAIACSQRFSAPADLNPPRLRIAYVSPDFRCHAVGTLICDMFQYHQRPDFEIFAYSLAPLVDDWTATIRQGCDHFIDVSYQAPQAIAQRIHADGIHILIDLAGYTAHSCTDLFAFQPASIQVQYLGYPGTMGAKYIQYILADAHLIPEQLAPHYSEEIIYLPHAWVASPMAIADATLTRSDCGLPDNGTVFCCFNAIYKIDPDVFAVWMRILQQVPDSVLWLMAASETVNTRLRQRAVASGVAAERLIFAINLPHADYLARYRLADLFLDTFIYNAGATAVGALWAGLPVLTCPHESYAARMGASLCYAAGLPEGVCDSPAAYEKCAIELGNHPGQLAELKAKLALSVTTSPLFQTQAFVLALEQGLQKMWQAYCKKGSGLTICNSS